MAMLVKDELRPPKDRSTSDGPARGIRSQASVNDCSWHSCDLPTKGRLVRFQADADSPCQMTRQPSLTTTAAACLDLRYDRLVSRSSRSERVIEAACRSS
jgi:hypothetical protein